MAVSVWRDVQALFQPSTLQMPKFQEERRDLLESAIPAFKIRNETQKTQ